VGVGPEAPNGQDYGASFEGRSKTSDTNRGRSAQMPDGLDPTQIIACAMRPQGSWMHFLTLAGFVWAAWSISPTPPDRGLARADRVDSDSRA